MKIFDSRFLNNLLALKCLEHDFTILTKCLPVAQNMWLYYCKNRWTDLHKTLYWAAFKNKVVLIRFCCIPLKIFLFFFSKILTSLTQRYRTKLLAILLNKNYFKPIILKFKSFIYNVNSKSMYIYILYVRRQNSTVGEESNFLQGEF